jgi:omega-amidase
MTGSAVIPDLRVALIQSALHWEDKKKNLQEFATKLNSLTSTVDLIVLPEMFTTGFSMQPQHLAESIDGDTVTWMLLQAAAHKCVITGSFICAENDSFYNRLVWAMPNGSVQYYDKRHLFSMGHETSFYTAGTETITVDINGWKIRPLICYDLRFPLWSRNTKDAPYDVLLYVANWPTKRAHAWNTLLMARAIENQVYVIGVNRVGDDGHGVAHCGDSHVLNALGEKMSNTAANHENIEIVSLNHAALMALRNSFPVLLDGDSFELNS